MPKYLTAEGFAQAAMFLTTQARPLERARYRFHFEDGSVDDVLSELAAFQNTDGGFPYDPDSVYGTASDTNSTAAVLQALLATGENPLSSDWATEDITGTLVISGTNPVAFLLSMQLPDGSFEWQEGFGTNQMATQQAAIALLYQPFPIRSATIPACEAVFLPFVSRD